MTSAHFEAKFSAQAVFANPQLLLHKASDKNHPTELTYQAAALVHCGENIIAAVNVPWVPELPPTGDREVFMRSNLRCGADDYIQWPQPTSGGYPHFAAILRKPQLPHHLEILWKEYHAHCPEFTPSSTPPFVVLCPFDLSVFDRIESQLAKQVTDYLEDPRSKGPESYRDVILIRRGWAHTFLARIKHIPMTRRELWRCLVEVQRFLLELHAALYWETICMPRILGLSPPASTTADTLGTFTTDPATVKQCVLAGLPVWMMLDIHHLPHLRIDTVVEFEKAAAQIVLDPGTRKHPTIFKGKATNPRRLQEIYLNSRHVLHTADVFATNYNPPPPRSDGPRSLNSAQANADSLRGIQVSYHPYRLSHLTGERRKNIFRTLILKPPVSPLLPSVHAAWLRATESLQLGDFPNDLPSDAGFAFAHPPLFFNSDDLNKDPASRNPNIKKSMIYRWLQLRPIMQHRVGPAVPATIAGPVSNRVWRRALQLDPSSFDAIRRDTSTKKNSAEKRDGLAFLDGSLLAANATVAVLQESPTWRGDIIVNADSIGEHMWKQVIWELSELNFRFELLALDRRLCRQANTRDSPERHELLLDCVVPPSFARALLIVEFHQSSCGLAHLDIRHRLPQLLHLRRLMTGWNPAFSGFSEVGEQSDDPTICAMEEALYTYYFRSFFMTFGRIPVVPRYL